MSETCPHCRESRERAEELEERVRQLEADLCGADFEAPREWGLTRREALIVQLLCRHPLVTRDLYVRAMEVLDPTWDAEVKILDVFVSKMRAKLRPFGVAVETVWGRGYQLAEAQREAVLAACRREGPAQLGDLAEIQQAAGRAPGQPTARRVDAGRYPTLSSAVLAHLKTGPAATPAIVEAVLPVLRPGVRRASIGAVLGQLADAGRVVRHHRVPGTRGPGVIVWALAEGGGG